jgi:hypothetical protein
MLENIPPDFYKNRLQELLVEQVNTDFEDLKKQEKSFYQSDVDSAKADQGIFGQPGLQLPITYTVNWSFDDSGGKRHTYRDNKNSRKVLDRAKERAEQVFSKFPNSKIWLSKWVDGELVNDELVIHEPNNWQQLSEVTEDVVVNKNLKIDQDIEFNNNEEELLNIFLEFVKEYLQLSLIPIVHILAERKGKMTYGAYSPDSNMLNVYGKNRGLADVMRTAAHELTHHKQNTQNKIPKDLNHRDETLENEANAVAGNIVYLFGLEHPEIYETGDSIESQNS